MRWVCLSALMLAGCSENGAADLAGTYAGPGRDRLCIVKKGEDLVVGAIVYGQGDANCTFRGTGVDQQIATKTALKIRPTGDSECEFRIDGNPSLLTLHASGSACNYYCGPGASLEGKTVKRLPQRETVNDFGGDPLC